MLVHKKILSFSIALFLLLTTGTLCGFAQSKIKQAIKTDKQHPITIAFQAGRELLFNSSPLLRSKQNKVHYGISKSLVLRKSLNTHFKLETGLNYTSYENTINTYNPCPLPGKINNSPYTYSIPITMQYHFLSHKCKVHPFCGAGFQCNFLNSKNNPANAIGMMDPTPQNYIPQTDTKYITILFTQGVTFEINTKIEVSQSIHFLPANNSNIIGIDLGIGYKFP